MQTYASERLISHRFSFNPHPHFFFVISLQTESYASEDELHLGLTEEQKLQKQLDAKNITVNLAVRGDGVNFPVRCELLCFFFFSSFLLLFSRCYLSGLLITAFVCVLKFLVIVRQFLFMQLVGDIVRVRYVASLVDNQKVNIALIYSTFLCVLFIKRCPR